MVIFVLNAGSSSLKCQLIDVDAKETLAEIGIERIGIDGRYKFKSKLRPVKSESVSVYDHKEAFLLAVRLLTEGETPILARIDQIDGIGHRIGMGGPKLPSAAVINEEVISEIVKHGFITPLHTPAQVNTVRACQEYFGMIPQVAVFDTGFNVTIPETVYTYAIPFRYQRKYGVRRYGFHGMSHSYVSERCALLLGRELNELKIVSCHIGNGATCCAIDGGKALDTTTGFGSFGGLEMGTRSGDIDPMALFHIAKMENLSNDQILELLTKRSGYLGLSEVSSDYREVEKAEQMGNRLAGLALTIQEIQIKKYIGAFAFEMGGLDAVIFTAGIGENSARLCRNCCKGLERFGISIDETKNIQAGGKEMDISAPGATVRVVVIPTNEEIKIATEAARLIKGGKK